MLSFASKEHLRTVAIEQDKNSLVSPCRRLQKNLRNDGMFAYISGGLKMQVDIHSLARAGSTLALGGLRDVSCGCFWQTSHCTVSWV